MPQRIGKTNEIQNAISGIKFIKTISLLSIPGIYCLSPISLSGFLQSSIVSIYLITSSILQQHSFSTMAIQRDFIFPVLCCLVSKLSVSISPYDFICYSVIEREASTGQKTRTIRSTDKLADVVLSNVSTRAACTRCCLSTEKTSHLFYTCC